MRRAVGFTLHANHDFVPSVLCLDRRVMVGRSIPQRQTRMQAIAEHECARIRPKRLVTISVPDPGPRTSYRLCAEPWDSPYTRTTTSCLRCCAWIVESWSVDQFLSVKHECARIRPKRLVTISVPDPGPRTSHRLCAERWR